MGDHVTMLPTRLVSTYRESRQHVNTEVGRTVLVLCLSRVRVSDSSNSFLIIHSAFALFVQCPKMPPATVSIAYLFISVLPLYIANC